MIFDKLFGRNKPKEIFNDAIPDKNEFAEALAEYAAQSITTGQVQTQAEIPPFRGDYSQAVFLWAVSKHSTIQDNDDDYPRYILYECGIRKPSEFHRKMIKEGYLQEDGFEKALESLKLAELKEIAEDKGVGTSGKKADIIKRIIQAGDIGYLQRQFPATFSISEKGKSFLAEHDECIQIHKHKTMLIGWDEYCKVKETCEDKSFYGVCTKILLDRAAKNKRTFGTSEYLFLSKLEDEFGDPKRALCYLLQNAYISVSGVMGMDCYKSYKEGLYKKEMLKGHLFSTCITPIGVTDLIRKHKDVYDDSILDILFSWHLPVMLCERELFSEIVDSIMDGTYNHQFFSAQLQVRFNRFVDSL